MSERLPRSNVQCDPEFLLRVALELSACGWRVFPVRNKEPLIRGFPGIGPFAAARIEQMPWVRASHIGLSLPPGFIGFDADVRPDGEPPKRGDLDMTELENLLGMLPSTFKQITPSGGFHLIFSCREFKSLPKQLWNSKGESCAIDIAVNGKLMLVLYEPALLLNADIAELPVVWDQYLRTPPSGNISKVSEAQIGQRNNTLNHEAFKIAVRDGFTPQLKQRLLKVAQQAGLDSREAADTIDSAFEAAERKRQPVLQWMQTIAADAAISSKRNKRRILAAAECFKRVHLLTGQTTIGMSSRYLAEQIGCQQRAAAEILRLLVNQGHLLPRRRVNAVDAKEYTLPLPKTNSSRLTHPEGEIRVSRDVQVSCAGLQKVLQHDVFRRVGGAGWLAESVGVVLHHLALHGDVPRRGLAGRLGMSAETLTRALRVLQEHVSVEGGLVCLRGTVDEVLTAFSQLFGAEGRRDALVAKHAKQRADRIAFFELKEACKQQGKRSVSG